MIDKKEKYLLRSKTITIRKRLVLRHRPFFVREGIKMALEGAVAGVLGKNLLLCRGFFVLLPLEI
jgi:hypothetical protein